MNVLTKRSKLLPQQQQELEVSYRVPMKHWKSKATQRRFMDELARKLNITKWQDWNRVTSNDIRRNGGASLLSAFKGSPFSLLESVYPEYPWDKKDRVKASPGYWRDTTNQRNFMDQLGRTLNIKQMQDWNRVTTRHVREYGGTGLLNVYNGSMFKILQSIYPTHPWNKDHREKKRSPKGFWDSVIHQRNFMDELGKKLNIKKMSDWSTVSKTLITAFGGSYFLRKYVSNQELLQKVYPEHDWSTCAPTFRTSYNGRFFKTQFYLSNLLKKLITDQHVLKYNFRYPDLRYPSNSHRKVEVDIFFASLSLAFEYQGESHYLESFVFPNTSRRTELDELKKKLFPTEGITLISIPFWWDKKEDSLVATIQSIRPDIMLATSSTGGIPISQDIPPNLQKKIRKKTIYT